MDQPNPFETPPEVDPPASTAWGQRSFGTQVDRVVVSILIVSYVAIVVGHIVVLVLAALGQL